LFALVICAYRFHHPSEEWAFSYAASRAILPGLMSCLGWHAIPVRRRCCVACEQHRITMLEIENFEVNCTQCGLAPVNHH